MCYCDCSEAIWQRCWASASDAKLRVGAVWGAAQVSLLVFVFGFGGFLAIWGGLWVPSGPDDPGNTILFSLLKSQGQQVGSSRPAPLPCGAINEGFRSWLRAFGSPGMLPEDTNVACRSIMGLACSRQLPSSGMQATSDSG